MSDSKTYVFQPDSNNALAALMPMLQSRGVDPAVLAMLGNRNGVFGGNGWDGIIALVVIAAIFGWGGNGGGIFGNRGGNAGSAEREMIMSAIQRNGTDISALASSVNCSEGQIMQAINNVATQICNLSAAEGQNSMQIINSIQAGNTGILSKLADCCCENRLAIADQTIDLQKLPSEQSIADCNGMVVSENKDAIINEVAAMAKISQSVLDSMDRHRDIVERCNQLLEELNPEVKREAERTKEMNDLRNEVADLKDMLAQLLNSNKKGE